MRKITRIVVHCSDSPDSRDIGVLEITQWHKQRGWSTIGYHYCVRRDGRVEEGRPVAQVGAHVSGHNLDTIGIVWVGRVAPSAEQYQSLLALVRKLCKVHKVTVAGVLGHKELDAKKTCPNLSMDTFRKDLGDV